MTHVKHREFRSVPRLRPAPGPAAAAPFALRLRLRRAEPGAARAAGGARGCHGVATGGWTEFPRWAMELVNHRKTIGKP